MFTPLLCSVICFTSLGHAATISGTITYDGKVPKLRALNMSADPICATKHSEPVLSESLVLGENSAMANVLVRIKSGLTQETYPTPTEPAVLNQAGCRYDPHVLGVQAGQPIEILNPDGTLHNIHALPSLNKEFNQAMPKFRKKMTKKFDQVEEKPFPVKCDVHPWMGGWVAVHAHPFFHVSDKSGTYTLSGVEAGTYEIEAWHEKLGVRSESITVGADETKTLDFTFSRP